jgi:hypothetical protein
MLFTDFTKWNRGNITDFLDVIKDLLSYKLDIESKIITMASNPIQALSLLIEFCS